MSNDAPNAPGPPAMSPNRDELTTLLRRLTADRRRALRRLALMLVASLVLAVSWAQHHRRVRAFVNGEIDLEGRPRYEPPHAVDRQALEGIDFDRVHAELIPAWTIALGRATSPSRQRYADRVFTELQSEVAPDPNLAELLRGTHRALTDDPIEHAHRLDYFLWAYNHYLDTQGIPWRLEASLALTTDRAIFRTLSYEVLADQRDPHGRRLRLLRRGDRTNTREGWLGHSGGENGALVLMERVLHFAARHVWPGLHPALDGRRPEAERAWLGYVREEIRAQLEPVHYALLEESAADQQALIEVQAAVAARAECGSRFSLPPMPYNGLSMRWQARLLHALERGQLYPECPEITLAEAAQLVGASERLASTPGLLDALEHLAMVVARAVAVHELQHVADGEVPACPGCPDELVGVARAEVSAYLSAFSTEGLGYLSLLQACATPRGPGVHGAALTAVLEVLLPYGCEGPTLHGLYPFAEQIERHLFGARPDVALPRLPPRVAILPRRPPHRRHPGSARPLATGWGMTVSPR